MEGRLPREPTLQREPMLQSEPMGDDSRSYNAPGLIPISPIHGEIHVFLLLQEYSYGSTEVSKVYPTFSIAYSIYSTSHQKHYSVWYFPSIILNPTPSTLININQKTNQRNTYFEVKNRRSDNQTLSEREITSNSSLSPGELQTPSQVTPW